MPEIDCDVGPQKPYRLATAEEVAAEWSSTSAQPLNQAWDSIFNTMDTINRSDAVKAIRELLDDLRKSPQAWENPTLERCREAIQAWESLTDIVPALSLNRFAGVSGPGPTSGVLWDSLSISLEPW